MKTILTLLIHFRTREEYYKDFQKAKRREIELLEKGLGRLYMELSESFKHYMEEEFSWPPWRFNDIVGYAVIRFENDWTMVADLYLPQNRITRTSKAKSFHLNYVVTETHLETLDLPHIRIAIYKLITQLEEILKKKKWHLEFDRSLIDNTDFLAILKKTE